MACIRLARGRSLLLVVCSLRRHEASVVSAGSLRDVLHLPTDPSVAVRQRLSRTSGEADVRRDGHTTGRARCSISNDGEAKLYCLPIVEPLAY